jgi:hypothetical protein
MQEAAFQLHAFADGNSPSIGTNLVEADEIWTRPLRNRRSPELYVSFVITASVGTEIHVGGWSFRLGRMASETFTELQYMAASKGDANWIGTGIVSAIQTFHGRQMAALPILTFRFAEQPERMVDVYANASSVRTLEQPGQIEGASLRGDGTLRIKGGEQGALLSSVVQADENPLFEDANKNGIDDEFETVHAMHRRPGTPAELKQDWREIQMTVGVPSLSTDRPAPTPDATSEGRL